MIINKEFESLIYFYVKNDENNDNWINLSPIFDFLSYASKLPIRPFICRFCTLIENLFLRNFNQT